MKKIVMSSLMILLSSMVIVVGVLATNLFSKQSNSTIDFVVGDVQMTVTGNIEAGGSTYLDETETIDNTNTEEVLAAWTPNNNITLSSANYVVTYTYTFKNNCEKSTTVTITPPTMTADFTLAGGFTGEGGGNSAVLANKDDTATFIYTITLINFTHDISAAQFNYTISMTLTA